MSDEGKIAQLIGTANGKGGVEKLKRPLRRHKPILENTVQCALETFSAKFQVECAPDLKSCGRNNAQSSSIMGRQFVVYKRLQSTAFVASSLKKIQCETKTVECTVSDSDGVVEGVE